VNVLLSSRKELFSGIGQIKKFGDLGIGTFNALDGEMIVMEISIRLRQMVKRILFPMKQKHHLLS